VKIAGTSIALSIMKSKGLLWLPVILGLGVHVLTIPLLMFCLKGPLLGIIRIPDITKSSSESYVPLLTEDSDDVELSRTSSETDIDSNTPDREPVSIAGSASVKSIQHFYLILPHCLLPVAIYTFRDFGESYRYLLPYWMSRRFHWDLREVGWVHLGETLFTSLIIALMPWFRKLYLRQQSPETEIRTRDNSAAGYDQELKLTSASAAKQDLSLAQMCIGFSMLGSVLLSLSWYRPSAFVSLAVLAVGMGFPDSYNSFLAGKIEEANGVDLQDIYMVMSIAGMMAALLGGWITSGVYSVALRLGGDSWATSSPIWFGAASFGVAWFISTRHKL